MTTRKKSPPPPQQAELILMRHGVHRNGELTEYGILQVTSIAEQLLSAGKASPIYTSPTHRAHQSALILKDVFAKAGENVELHVVEWLRCDTPYKGEIATDVDERYRRIIAVSHQPNIEEMTAYFAQYSSPREAEARTYVRPSWKDYGPRASYTELFKPK